MAAAPAIVLFVGGEVSDALDNTLRMYEITLAEHPFYKVPILAFRGTPTGIDATLVVRSGVLPAVNTGIAGREPGVGQVGCWPCCAATVGVRRCCTRARVARRVARSA